MTCVCVLCCAVAATKLCEIIQFRVPCVHLLVFCVCACVRLSEQKRSMFNGFSSFMRRAAAKIWQAFFVHIHVPFACHRIHQISIMHHKIPARILFIARKCIDDYWVQRFGVGDLVEWISSN